MPGLYLHAQTYARGTARQTRAPDGSTNTRGAPEREHEQRVNGKGDQKTVPPIVHARTEKATGDFREATLKDDDTWSLNNVQEPIPYPHHAQT